LARLSAKGRCPPGEAIRDPSRRSTALNPEPTAQTDPSRSLSDARSFHDRIEDLPMERGDFPPSLQMRPIPRDEIGTVCKRGRKGGAITRIPSVDHSPMDGTDRILVCGSLRCWL